MTSLYVGLRNRLSVVAAIPLLLVLVCAARCTAADEASDDAKQLRGHWVAVKMRVDGKNEDPAGACQVVFTDKEMKMSGKKGGESYGYRLDPDKTPKEIDLKAIPGSMVKIPPLASIYRIDGQRLWLCLPTTTRDPRPDSFASEAGDRRYLYLLERAKPNPDGLPSYMSEGFKPADRTLTAELRKRVADGIALIEDNQPGKFMIEFASSAEFEKMLKTTNKTREQFIKEMKTSPNPGIAPRMKAFVLVLRALEKKIPSVNADGTEARFDIRDTHVNGMPGRPEMIFFKSDGKWCIRD
jgi:uncharacterized protein (TIGR03067 family)